MMPRDTERDARLMDYLYDELSSTERTAFERELETDGALRAQLAELRSVRVMVRRAAPPPAAPAALMQRIVREARLAIPEATPSMWERAWAFFSQPAVATAAVVVVIAGSGLVLLQRDRSGVDTDRTSRAPTSEVALADPSEIAGRTNEGARAREDRPPEAPRSAAVPTPEPGKTVPIESVDLLSKKGEIAPATARDDGESDRPAAPAAAPPAFARDLGWKDDSTVVADAEKERRTTDSRRAPEAQSSIPQRLQNLKQGPGDFTLTTGKKVPAALDDKASGPPTAKGLDQPEEADAAKLKADPAANDGLKGPGSPAARPAEAQAPSADRGPTSLGTTVPAPTAVEQVYRGKPPSPPSEPPPPVQRIDDLTKAPRQSPSKDLPKVTTLNDGERNVVRPEGKAADEIAKPTLAKPADAKPEPNRVVSEKSEKSTEQLAERKKSESDKDGSNAEGRGSAREYQEAMTHYKNRRYDLALKGFEKVLRDRPSGGEAVDAEIGLARTFERTSQLKNAVDRYRQVLARYPAYPYRAALLVEVATTEIRVGDLQSARAHLLDAANDKAVAPKVKVLLAEVDQLIRSREAKAKQAAEPTVDKAASKKADTNGKKAKPDAPAREQRAPVKSE